MTLEDMLTELGDNTLVSLPNYRAMIAYMNSSFTKANVEHVSLNTPSDLALEKIYSLIDPDMQTTLLNRPIKDLKPDNKFKKVLVFSGFLITTILVVVVLLSIFSNTGITPETIELLKDIGSGVFDVVKILLDKI